MRRIKEKAQHVVERVTLVYDGGCPLCSNYARLLRLRESVGDLVLVDARDGGPLVDEVRALPHDLNTGMVVMIGEQTGCQHYAGHEALHVLALLSERRGLFNRLNRLVFSSPQAARVGYPVLKLVRWVLLKLRRIGPID